MLSDIKSFKNNKINNKNCLKILTANCQGFGDINKRRDILKFPLKSNSDHIYFLQDFLEKDENFIQTQWECKAFFNSFKSNPRGVAVQ